uniref:Transcription initiation factor IIA subunit 2 n=1 Tax=Octactis speculum TaxID=3111310 RepID=A0A7S2CAJ0_9STRA|mmetsp:Transcript_33576/g.45358  ORF Transcript_33576/g.45358 Transcript_33576/m.45358 type:complete len:126 (+) Transcript_33576:115-492(+)
MSSDDHPLRWATLGESLIEILVAMKREKQISKKEAKTILSKFDQTIEASMLQPPSKMQHGNLKGELRSYNCLDGMWKIELRKAELELSETGELIHLHGGQGGILRIIAIERGYGAVPQKRQKMNK